MELASLMESSGSAMKIQITSATKVECISQNEEFLISYYLFRISWRKRAASTWPPEEMSTCPLSVTSTLTGSSGGRSEMKYYTFSHDNIDETSTSKVLVSCSA